MIETETELTGRLVGASDPLPFRCHPGLACFNSCCRDKHLMLLPFDVLRMSRGLGCGSAEFLAQRVELEIEPSSGWPTLRLKLEPDGRCPFVGEAGCGVYANRPACCRIYPLGRAVRLDQGGEPREAFVAIDTGESCLGFGAQGNGTVEEWVRGQGFDEYKVANDAMARLFLDPRRPRPLSLSSDEVHAVVMALYNVDVFREFVAQPGFAARAGVESARVERALASDEALLELGRDWLSARLFR